VTSYADERRAERTDEEGGAIPGAANGTINRELETLSKMLRLAYTNGKLTRLPFVEKLAEAPPRVGFVTREQFDAIRKRLPEELPFATVEEDLDAARGSQLREQRLVSAQA